MRKEIARNPILYSLLSAILLVALFLRIYRADQILGFYFDQGRDANVIFDLLYKGKFFLIGPTTGIAGLFRGPFYYYLIAPFYWLGNGNPLYPAVFLALLTVIAIALSYFIARVMENRLAGLFTAILASFSFFMIVAARWLSNPTPMLLLGPLLLYFMLLVVKGKKVAWIGIWATLGLSLFHFGSSGEFFYFPAIFLFALWQRKNFPSFKILLTSFIVFAISVMPLLIFDLRHDRILSNNISKFLFEEGSFKSSFWEVVGIRLQFYYDVVVSKIFPTYRHILALQIIGVSTLFSLPSLWKNKFSRTLLILLFSPVIGLLFFQGNFGNIYDYYMTGYYMIALILLGLVLAKIWTINPGKIFVIVFLCLFISQNLEVTRSRITDKLDGPETIALGNQKQAIEWIYKDANGEPFNVDVYVPPVIPHAYDYLFRWYGGKVLGYEPETKNLSLLYTLYEEDPPHPERLSVWLARQKGIAVVESEQKFGGITVQRRKRL